MNNFMRMCEQAVEVRDMYNAVKGLGMFIPERLGAAKSLYADQIHTLEHQLELIEVYAKEGDYDAVDDCWMLAKGAATRAILCADAPRRAANANR